MKGSVRLWAGLKGFRKRNIDVLFDVLLTVHLSEFISVFNQLDAHNLFHNKFYFMPLRVSCTCAHHQEVKIALHSPDRQQVATNLIFSGYRRLLPKDYIGRGVKLNTHPT